MKEGTATYEAWKGTQIPIYMKVYFFSMLNAEAFTELGERPVLEERGPYTFRQVEKKVNIVWHEDNTLSYQRKKYWWECCPTFHSVPRYFEPTMSVGPLEDTVSRSHLHSNQTKYFLGGKAKITP